MVQRLELRAFTTKGPLQSLVGKLRSHRPYSAAKKKKKALEKTFTRHMGKCEYLLDIKYTGIIANFFRRIHVALYLFFLEVSFVFCFLQF